MNRGCPLLGALCIIAGAGLGACDSVDDERLPSMPVNISLDDAGTWNTYGVSGFGTSREFILSGSLRIPSGFHYPLNGATGYGGVLLISGFDPLTLDADTPLAYDMSCPVERSADVRVSVQGDAFEAVCGKCGSRYDVAMGGGAPVAGPAASRDRRYGLKRYRCLPSVNGGYLITN